MYQAPIVALVIIIAYVWRMVTVKMETSGTKVPLYAHYYTILYLLTLLLTVLAIKSMFTDVLSVSGWLDAETVESFVKEVMRNSPGDVNNQSAVFAAWKEEADISDKPWLKYLAITSPVFCLGTFLVCAWHTFDHIKLVKFHGGISKAGEALWSDNIILILSLPMIYGLMSFKSVIRSLQIYINHIPPAGGQTSANMTKFQGYEDRKDFLSEMYAANFAVGDLMETIALVTFGELIADYLKHRMRITEKHMKDKNVEELDVNSLKAATETVASLTIAGVQLFCLACVISSSWDLLITTMPSYFPGVADSLFSTDPRKLGSLQTPEMKGSAEQFFLGFSFAASFAAIGNIMTLEHNYHEFLELFEPSMKFWGTKMLVSLACLQSSVLACLPGTPVTHNLIYACILNIECFLIAIFHMKAWGAEEEWLKHQHNEEEAVKAVGMARSKTAVRLSSRKSGVMDEPLLA